LRVLPDWAKANDSVKEENEPAKKSARREELEVKLEIIKEVPPSSLKKVKTETKSEK